MILWTELYVHLPKNQIMPHGDVTNEPQNSPHNAKAKSQAISCWRIDNQHVNCIEAFQNQK